jgi:hypothetical protein
MKTLINLGGWAAAIMAIIVTALYGPFVAGFVFVGIAFAIIASLLVAQAGHAINDWRLEHPTRLFR